MERQNIYEQYPSKRDMVDAIYNLRASKKALESELKDAEDHAATMETCAKDAEEKLGKAGEDILTYMDSWAKAEHRESKLKEKLEKLAGEFGESNKIFTKCIDGYKQALANSVPFEVIREKCSTTGMLCELPWLHWDWDICTPDSCPLIPKAQTDE